MENNPANKKTDPDLHNAAQKDIGSPLNTGHLKSQTTGTNDQDGDRKQEGSSPAGNNLIRGVAPAEQALQDDRSAGGLNDPEANKTPHPGPTDGA